MKAILVIDVDDEYLGKEISVIKFTNGSAIFCETLLTPPLIFKPLPQKKEIREKHSLIDAIPVAVRQGYNACIDEILEGEEENEF